MPILKWKSDIYLIGEFTMLKIINNENAASNVLPEILMFAIGLLLAAALAAYALL